MVKNMPANAGDKSLIPGLGRSPGGGNGNPLRYSCLGNPMDREAWWATVHGSQKCQTQVSNKTTTKVNIYKHVSIYTYIEYGFVFLM